MAVYRLTSPADRGAVARLRIGDTVYVTGLIFTARDQAHRKIISILEAGGELPFPTRDMLVYHAGPVARKRGDGSWEIIAAGPTTSARIEKVEPRFIELTGVAMIAGKGGMGPATAEACRRHRCAYLAFTGGAAVLAAQAVERVEAVYWLEELGMAEAVWLLRVSDFGPLTVVIDPLGRDLYQERLEEARRRAEELAGRLAARLKAKTRGG